MVFRHETIQCRDDSSFEECKRLGLTCIRRDDILLEERGMHAPPGKVVAIDTRYRLLKGIFDNGVSAYCERLNQIYENLGYTIVEVPTIQTDLDWRHIKSLFEGVNMAICVSFHAAIFASNAGATVVCVYGDEYYRRKFSALKNIHLVDVRVKRSPISNFHKNYP